jgi:hypothetical protein
MAADILEHLAAEAIRVGADALAVEYEYGCEWVFAAKGPLGFGIASFPNSIPDAAELQEPCYRLAQLKRARRIEIDGREYELRCAVYGGFGKDAFRLSLRPVPRPVLVYRPDLRTVGHIRVTEG